MPNSLASWASPPKHLDESWNGVSANLPDGFFGLLV
jgi:hypothetical protein